VPGGPCSRASRPADVVVVPPEPPGVHDAFAVGDPSLDVGDLGAGPCRQDDIGQGVHRRERAGREPRGHPWRWWRLPEQPGEQRRVGRQRAAEVVGWVEGEQAGGAQGAGLAEQGGHVEPARQGAGREGAGDLAGEAGDPGPVGERGVRGREALVDERGHRRDQHEGLGRPEPGHGDRRGERAAAVVPLERGDALVRSRCPLQPAATLDQRGRQRAPGRATPALLGPDPDDGIEHLQRCTEFGHRGGDRRAGAHRCHRTLIGRDHGSASSPRG
jgi:hypothetical protein